MASALALVSMFAEEPCTNFELVKHANVICTPHLGASSKEAQNRVAVDLANQISKYVRQNVLEGGVNASSVKL